MLSCRAKRANLNKVCNMADQSMSVASSAFVQFCTKCNGCRLNGLWAREDTYYEVHRMNGEMLQL